MHREILFVFLLIAVITGAVAPSISIGSAQESVYSIETPESATGLTWDGEYLWYSSHTDLRAGQSEGRIRQVDPSTGEIVTTFNLSYERPSGLTWDGEHLWSANGGMGTNNDHLRKIDPATGEVVDKIPAPGPSSVGLAYDGQYLWSLDYVSYAIYQIDPESGKAIQVVSLSQRAPSGVAWGSGFLWVTEEANSEIHQIDPSVSTEPVVDSIQSPGRTPSGIAWDGQYLWVGGSDSRIYRVDVGEVGQPNAPPNATFDYMPTNPAVGQEITIDASESSDSDGYIERYEWDFDGDRIADARGEQVTHTFESTGNHTIRLTVTDESGTDNSVNRSVQVMETTTTDSSPQSTDYGARSVSTAEQTSTTSRVNEGTKSSTAPPQTTARSSVIEDSSTARTSSESSDVQRGFFSNGPDSGSFDPLADPFLLTLGGFVFSVAGILLQLTRGS